MDLYWESLSTYTGTTTDHPYLPEVDEPVWILGTQHGSVSGLLNGFLEPNRELNPTANAWESDDTVDIREIDLISGVIGSEFIYRHSDENLTEYYCHILLSEKDKYRDLITADIQSRLWFTYRKGFPPIKGLNGPTCDSGWGCMHRCGQMMLAQALIHIHLGRSWRWNLDRLDPPYLRILKMFEDHAKVPYSLHSITAIALCDDKPINSWLGPNTVAQAIKKLSALDRWTNLAVCVTTEDGVIIQEIKKLCRPSHQPSTNRNRKSNSESGGFDSALQGTSENEFANYMHYMKQRNRPVVVTEPISKEVDTESVEVIYPPVVSNDQIEEDKAYEVGDDEDEDEEVDVEGIPVVRPSETSNLIEIAVAPISSLNSSSPLTSSVSKHQNSSSFTSTIPSLSWRPLLLIVPLRLGLHDINMCYLHALKGLFKLPQCVGIIGGKPNHALWLIGYVGDNVLCLDPHTTQPARRLGQPSPGSTDNSSSLDGSYHCASPIRLPFDRLDPSLAIGFVCSSETQFDELCSELRADVLSNRLSPPIFEIHETRPHNLPPPFSTITLEGGLRMPEEWSELYSNQSTSVNYNGETDDDFELI